ncbi:RelA/SpoT family protein [Psychrobacter sp. FDAARGOS_221]|uniref:RelA/SpoT family protein n=1 Tax=Psychrobacter sp. FDAARGOS_221 TaxID=1975705 RepID=UPI000BB55692|nr:bifunctional (p)ppGpp synthetase/guanosine-3',5'-bis(diphosphate) 3'-pyrophosphohydrolase [Psychrobacter sp. FDAARGOS_221]PNK60372.1 bifunctional (p)ppGpp synthetase/guanosine-3',5'-bis(diphosphate) 3'-pyrophosphohydrolase [Psychrobacter sp. FDAARGOS_221]
MVKVREGLPLIDGQTTAEDSASLAAQMIAQQQHGYYNPTRVSYDMLNEDLKKQLATSKLTTAMDRTLQADILPLNDVSILKKIQLDNLTYFQNTAHPTTGDHVRSNSNMGNQGDSSVSTAETDAKLTDEPTKKLAENTLIDLPAWLKAVSNRVNISQLPDLAKACDLIGTKSSLDEEGGRSSAFMTGIGMTDILTYLYQDEDALTAAMLYRAARTQLITHARIQEVFGNEVATLVKDALAMGRLSEIIESNKHLEDHFVNNQREQLSNIYSMLISMTNDVRVVLIKLAERTFAMRELSYASEERRQRVSREVMTIYAPLAHRLGIAQIKWELEDLAFRYLAPERYKETAKLLAEKRSEREAYIERVQAKLENALKEAGIKGEVSGRVKHIYSIYRKMKLKGLSFDQLYDIRALRVLVDTPAECYHTLGLVHGMWRHIPEQFDDYITNPKANGYRSLHTAVIAEHKSLEIQIRTHQMHFEAELGMCAHVNYKEGGKNKQDAYLSQKINSLRQLLLAGSDNTNKNLLDPNLTEEFGQDVESDDEQLVDFGELEHIYVFSRDGDITELPKGATVLDFAYYVHTQVGNRAQAARVNQRFVPLTYQLKTGEQVEIITKSSREPNRDWLVPSLGYIQTSRARSKLRQWFNKQDRDKNLEIGKQMLAKELARLSVSANSVHLKDYVKHFGMNSADDILIALVTGEIGLHQLTGHISRELNLVTDKDEPDYVPNTHHTQHKSHDKQDANQVYIDGLDNIETRFANCCQPIYGEPIAGFITQSSGVSIHNRGCAEYARLIEREPERQISATWTTQQTTYQPVEIIIEAYDRRGLLRDLTQVIDKENINIRGVDTNSDNDNVAHLKFKLEVTGLSQLSKLLAKLEQQPGILHARRAV